MPSLPKLFPFAIIALLFAVSPVFAQKLSLADIIDAHIKALGGKEAISKVDNVERKATVSLESGFGTMSGTVEEIADLNGKRYYNNLDLGQYKKTQAMAGGAGWFKGTDGDGELSDQDIAFAKMNLGVSPLLSAHETAKGLLKVKGIEEFGDKECHVVAVGSEVEYFVGTKSSLLEGLKISGVGTMSLSNYTETEGVQFPGEQTFNIKAQGITISYSFSSTTINTEIDDSLFGDLADSQESGGPEYSAEQIVSFLDKDGDEKISHDEAKASPELSPAFDFVDTSKDGFIDITEAQAMVNYTKNQQETKKPSSAGRTTAKQVIASMDKDNDGKISKREASEELKPFFGDTDANDDGFIDEKEGQTLADYLN